MSFALSDITPERVSKAVVDPEFFGVMMRKLAAQHGDDQGPGDPHLAAFFAYVEENDLQPGKGEHRPNLRLEDHLKIAAAVRRFFAMGALERTGHLKHWIKDRGDHVMMHPALIEAACSTQLLVRGEEFYFQPMEYLNNALKAANENEPFAR